MVNVESLEMLLKSWIHLMITANFLFYVVIYLYLLELYNIIRYNHSLGEY